MARVHGSGSPSLTSAAAFQTQLLSLPTLGESFISGTTMITLASSPRHSISPTGEAHTIVIRANLQSLIPPHNQPCLLILPMLEQPHIPCATLLPLPRITVEFEKLSAHFERLFLLLFICSCLDFLRKMHNRRKLNIGLMLCISAILKPPGTVSIRPGRGGEF